MLTIILDAITQALITSLVVGGVAAVGTIALTLFIVALGLLGDHLDG